MTPVLTGALLALFTLIQTWINKGRFDALEERQDRHFEHLSSEIAALRSVPQALVEARRLGLS